MADRATVTLFITALGGNWAIPFWSLFVGSFGLSDLFDSMEIWWLGYWATQYTILDPDEISVAL